MPSAPSFILTRPWGLYTAHLRLPERLPLVRGEPLSIKAEFGLAVVGDGSLRFRFAGQKVIAAQREGGIFVHGGGDRAYFTIPAGSTAREAAFRIVVADGNVEEVYNLSITDGFSRPAQPGEVVPAERQLSFLLSIVERMRALAETDADDEALDHHADGGRLISTRIPWERLVKHFCRERGGEDPLMDIIVKHAATLPTIVESLASHPRRILKRVRERQPIARAQELDAACLQWFVRQPGRTVAEKAGSRQSILAVTRQGTFDTLENRVLHDYLDRAALAAASYSALHKRARHTARVKDVERYARQCRQLGWSLNEAGVGYPVHPVGPNYVLQQDSRYRHVWKAYLQLLRRESEIDDIWRWQVRLWAEFCRLAIIVALRRQPAVQVLAEAPLWLKADQSRGRWADTSAHPAILLVEGGDWNGRVVITVIDAQDETADRFGDPRLWRFFWSVGAAAVIHVQEMATGVETWILVWALHHMAFEQVDLNREAKSADSALAQLQSQIKFELSKDVDLGGFVLASSPTQAVDRSDDSFGRVVAFSTALDEEALDKVIEEITKILPTVVSVASHA